MSVVTFKAAAADDAWISREGEPAWPPTANTNTNTGSAEAPLPEKNYYEAIGGSPYYLGVGYVRWDTSSLPNDAVVSAARFIGQISNVIDAEGRSFCMEWVPSAIAPANSLWTSTVAQDAYAPVTLASLIGSIGSDVAFNLLSPAANINLTGYTALRSHITGSTAPAFAAFPAATLNFVAFYARESDNGTTILGPRLEVTYTSASETTYAARTDFDVDMDIRNWF